MSRSGPSVHESPRAVIVHLALLGGFHLTVNGRPVQTLTAPRLQSLLGYLFLNPGRQIDRSYLASLFWPELSEDMARGHLRKSLFKLKECLPAGLDPLEISKSTILWHAPSQCDVLELEALLDDPTSLEQLKRIQRHYTGELLPGCTDSWCSSRRESLKTRVLSVLDDLSSRQEASRRYGEAAETLRSRLNMDPCSEETWFRLFRVHLALGDRSAAQGAWQACRAVLARELQVEPSAAFKQAVDQLSRSRTEPGAQSLQLPLVGRVAEWEALLQVWQRTAQGLCTLVVVEGVPGIGKTRLAEALSQYVRTQGQAEASSACVPSEQGSAFAALALLLRGLPLPDSPPSLLSELARLVPELHERAPSLPPVLSLNEPGQRLRFFQAIARALLEHEPLLLWIDDIQWCDEGTLEFVQFFFRTHPGRKVLWLATLRSGEEASLSLLQRELIPGLRRQKRLLELFLGPLSAQESATLAQAEAREGLSSHVLEALHAEAEGTPLYLLELLRARHLHGPATLMAGQYPQTLTEAVVLRMSILSAGARQVLELLAVTRGPASHELLALASVRAELETILDLEELVKRRLVEERSDATFRIAHALVSAIVYQLLSQARRRALHRSLADALEKRGAGPELAPQLAFHLEKAQLLERAGLHWITAGERAMQLGDNRLARLHLEKALSYPGIPSALRLKALGQLAQALTMLGDVAACLAIVTETLSLSRSTGDTQAHGLALIHQAHLFQRQGLHPRAEAPLSQALLELPSEHVLTRLQAHSQRAELALHLLKLESIWEDCIQVCRSYEQLEPSNSEVGLHISGGMAMLWVGQMARARQAIDLAYCQAHQQERRDWEGVACYWRAFLQLREGRLELAEHDFREAIRLAHLSETLSHLPLYQAALGSLLSLQGRFREARGAFSQGEEPNADEVSSPPTTRFAAEVGYLVGFLGQYQRGTALLVQALESARRTGSVWRQFRYASRLCSLALAHRRLDDAASWVEQCEQILPLSALAPFRLAGPDAQTVQEVPFCVNDLTLTVLACRGELLLHTGAAAEALPLLREAALLRQRCLLQIFEWDPHFSLIEAHLACGDPLAARCELEYVASSTGGQPLSRAGLARYHGIRAQVYRAQGDEPAALGALTLARQSLRRIMQELSHPEERPGLLALPYHAPLHEGL